MRAVPRVLVIFAVLSALAASQAAAQRDRAPSRPGMPATADTNDAQAYFHLGMQEISRRPGRAAEAFYWATRLAPAWGDAYYGEWAARHLSNQNRFVRYFAGQRGVVNSREVRQIDSLITEALYRNPFHASRFERLMLDQVLIELTGGISRQGAGGGAMNPSVEAYLANIDGRYEEATRHYGEALRRRPRDYHLRAPRARAFYHQTMFDSAANELVLLLDEMRRRDDERLVYYYDSKAMLEYTLARAYSAQGDRMKAREALGRALEEDLSFHMAHVEMSELSMAAGDTSAALSELAMAVELRGDDASVQLYYADALAAAGQREQALEHYRAAIAAEPWFARPYYQLGRALEEIGEVGEAVERYREFVARAARSNFDLDDARQRMDRLSGSGGAP